MRSPAQTWARLIGFVLLAAGVIGFFYSSAFGTPGHTDSLFGILEVNGWGNVLHIVTGALALALAGSYSSARSGCILLAVVYAIVAIWGFALGHGGAILSIIPVNVEDNVFHAIVAVASLALGIGTAAVPPPSTHTPGPTLRYN